MIQIQLSHYLTAIVNFKCDGENEPQIEARLKVYMEVLRYLQRNKEAPVWSETKVNHAHQRIRKYKT